MYATSGIKYIMKHFLVNFQVGKHAINGKYCLRILIDVIAGCRNIKKGVNNVFAYCPLISFIKMECVFESYLSQEHSHLDTSDIPQTKEPVWILGKKYNPIQELEIIRQDIISKLWFTYRKGFVPIGGANGLTTDKGWGCMLRCGQMVLAQALVVLHLGREWFWTPETRDPTYLKILKKFEDVRQAPFSIHQIAVMGASEGKEVGQWFGPNTVAQVLKKLVVYDEWSSVTIHVALDNVIIINEIKTLCLRSGNESSATEWKPLLLIVPLRLGLNEINPIYVNGIKTCFKFKQSLGMIGGKPNLALYFIGCVEDEVLYLDPHTTQKSVMIDKDFSEQLENDASYHCKYASRIPILSMDPSVALCFFCHTEEEFENLCQLIRDELIIPESQPLFELSQERQQDWIPTTEDAKCALETIMCNEFDDLEKICNSEDEFEIV